MVFLLPWSLIAKGPPLWQEAIGLYASILAEHTCHEVSSIHSVYCADSVAANTTCLKACLCSRDLQIVGDLQIFFFCNICSRITHTRTHLPLPQLRHLLKTVNLFQPSVCLQPNANTPPPAAFFKLVINLELVNVAQRESAVNKSICDTHTQTRVHTHTHARLD